ncbi:MULTISPECIES: DUF4435 domain-containing protein [Rhizobium]|uniref:DUF4435 domain-containing protein n=1 Tax=Rhizobium TaxID=379 RepID=UPI001B334B46|nr:MULTISPECIES: DUF4435 domain-containing protein [Rhizobium]MBX4911930.1 DUF4435 domain-containing protein [Rhizobium bangladeshense]MBX5177151.1 DUF4435 domain-containing protein [Rhizobium lentis]MBX5254727.1 DUF4435 domain-containing protein [Rhizobium sp. NLR4b]MBX5260878.1 DUF4435 domain-containing protein [Rhizobium sp. NLR16b]MBX5266962.1 DUF4435 domain-containing protein [Rhizobium sp. NLR16a]
MWTIEPLPSATELPRDLLVRMVGSRKPILFVEGKQGGLDETIYRAIYGNFTVIPSGSCGQVIQFVRSFRKQEELHWLHCAGLVDRDNRDPAADGALEEGIFTLPVHEVENLLLAPEVFFALAEELKSTPPRSILIFTQNIRASWQLGTSSNFSFYTTTRTSFWTCSGKHWTCKAEARSKISCLGFLYRQPRAH